MPQGLIVRDEAGNITLDLSTRCGRILEILDLNINSNGSTTPAGSDQGTLFALRINNASAADPWADMGKTQPKLTTTATTVSWDWGSSSVSSRQATTLIIGVY
ncbi:hypothetical protein [Mesorhizobium sp.]|uniref:hypothetical protein n=1 Tax=Mesorhizobium sp. TaxID=1871066 RepID=UPI000FE4D924|nr:hypothetical protein [Mesorhizobium sp.]RWD47475.1 MAG: hypothetical protein EOS35_06430 [Mesorhizobium sp.]TIU09373.1 MAG: hypothetical protein E5W39_03075 [Mesorhizobium sp.]